MAVSLHSHTHHSKESLGFFPHYIEYLHTPIVSEMLRAGMKRFEKSKSKELDFSRAYWTPPVTPGMVVKSEKKQIVETLGLNALVSVTDHDTIDGPLSLQRELASEAEAPVSVEWTVPFADDTFHLGIHHLPAERAVDIMTELARYTNEPSGERLGELLALLDGNPETLVVLNHPLQNILRVGTAEHLASLRRLLSMCRPWIHALEFNGMRSWKENLDVLRMAEDYDLPVVAGGDRHGCHASTVVNLSRGETWGEFVEGIRGDRKSAILTMTEYEEPAPLRELAIACDVLRHQPHGPYGKRRFTDRIFYNLEGYGWHPLSFYWDGGDGMPKWLGPAVTTLLVLGSEPCRMVMSWIFSRPEQFDRTRLPEENPACESENRQTSVTAESE